jgi:hypothetical protein
MPTHVSRFSRTVHYAILAFFILGILLLLKESQHEVEKLQTPPGFAIDDAWIHATLAKSLIQGEGFGINSGQWITASTAPAWTLSLAGMMLLFHDPVISAFVLATLCQIASVVLVYLLMLRFTGHRFWSAVPALLLSLNPILLWGFPSGMEHPMVVLSIVSTLYIFESSQFDSRLRLIGFPLSLVLCALSRPELLLLAPAGLVAQFYQTYTRPINDLKKGVRICLIQGAIFSLGMLPYFAINYATTRHIFPTAFFVKTQLRNIGISGAVDSGNVSQIFRQIVDGSVQELVHTAIKFLSFNPFLFSLIPLGLISLIALNQNEKRGRIALLLTLTVLLPMAIGIAAPSGNFSNYANRYLTLYVPGIMILQGLGLWFLWDKLRQKYVAILILLLGTIYSAKQVKPGLKVYARDVKNTHALYVEPGQWLHSELSPEIVVAVNDIGGISYFSDHEIQDIMGLGSQDIWPYLLRSNHSNRIYFIMEFMKDLEIDYLMVSPKYYPHFKEVSDNFEIVHQWDAVFPTGRSIDPQILYRINRYASPIYAESTSL